MDRVTTGPGNPATVNRSSTLSRVLFWVGLLIIPTILIIQVLVYQPFFGIYHDGQYVQAATQSFVELLRVAGSNSDHGVSHYGYWGAGSLSHLILSPQYWLATTLGVPYLLFLINTFLVIIGAGLLLFGAYVNNLISKRLLPACAAVLFLWPYTYDLIVFPILPEKGVIGGAGIILLLIACKAETSRLIYRFLVPLAIVLVLLGVGRSILLFVPFFLFIILIQFSQKPSRDLGFRFLAVIISGLTIFFGVLTAPYAQEMRSQDFYGNATSSTSIIYIITIFAFLAAVFFLRLPKNDVIFAIGPLILLLTFWIALVAYGAMNQWLSIYGVPIAIACGFLLTRTKRRGLQLTVTLLAFAGAIVWTLYRVPQFYEPLHGIGEFITSPRAQELGKESSSIEVSCAMGAGYLKSYMLAMKIDPPDFIWRPGEDSPPNYVLADQRLCSPPRDLTSWTVVWSSSGAYGFDLYENPEK